MHDCIILGSGRSGTSLLAGMLARAGYFIGDNYIEPRAANPKGFFEDSEVNLINDEIIARTLSKSTLYRVKKLLGHGIPTLGHWLAALPLSARLSLPPGGAERIQERLSHRPFCYKDPRFCYTLPLWRPYLPPSTRFLVIFRDPITTARSMCREQREARYLSRMSLSIRKAGTVWAQMYKHVLKNMREESAYLFVDYADVVDGTVLAAIEEFLEVSVDRTFPEKGLSRSRSSESDLAMPGDWAEVYSALLDLSKREMSIGSRS